MKRRKRSIAGRYVQIDGDGRRPSTAGQLAELEAPLGALLDEDEEDEDDVEDDVDDSEAVDVDFGFVSAAFEESLARLSVR